LCLTAAQQLRKSRIQNKGTDMSHNPFAKRRLISTAVIFSVCLSYVTCAPRGIAACPGDNCDGKGGGSGGGNGSNDPAFVMSTKTADIGAIQKKAISQASEGVKKTPDLVASEQSRYLRYVEFATKTPAGAFNEALAIWKENASVNLQRAVVLKAMGIVKNPEERDALLFMFAALDDVNGQRQACAQMGRGNSAEKSIAAKHVALLETNPHLMGATEK
jgi:hypothetical protein